MLCENFICFSFFLSRYVFFPKRVPSFSWPTNFFSLEKIKHLGAIHFLSSLAGAGSPAWHTLPRTRFWLAPCCSWDNWHTAAHTPLLNMLNIILLTTAGFLHIFGFFWPWWKQKLLTDMSEQVYIKECLWASWPSVCSLKQGHRACMVLINRINGLRMYFGSNLWPMASFPEI